MTIKRIAAAVIAAAFLAAPAAQAHPRVWLSAKQARASTRIASERWLGRAPAHVRCRRLGPRRFECSLFAEGATSGRLGRVSCLPACTVWTHMVGLDVRLVRSRVVLVTQRHHDWAIRTTIHYQSAHGSGIASGRG